MVFSVADAVGLVAAVLTTASFWPQVRHTWRTRDVSGISLGMYCVLAAGIVCWLAYGILLRAVPVIAANVVTLVLVAVILVMKLRFQA
ncbi:SemiSWEET family sugar transporter [Candidatus Symbiobacter mobilis]|uniref:MtN3 and saliva related transmembrane protein n=1 Tax=Candidatus Symbiobacter mobilis CR TaxID=946483 RepID=U5NAU8_9BURK|nr:SemiSWEET transporter [Candidatus Symbiobacter mobilis]AGX88537.1 hypothetical protein Cenrod_2483 [Candidatus Symbiobacter mobilis CR]